MTAQRRVKPLTVTVEQPSDLPRSVRLYGSPAAIRPALERTSTVHQYDTQRRCYLVNRRTVDNVLAALELAGHRVDVQMPGWPT